MKLNIKSEKENPLLERKELKISINHEGEPTPSEQDLRSKIAAQRDLNTNLIVIDGIYSSFGSNYSKAYLRILENPEEAVEEEKSGISEDKEKIEDTEEVEEESGEVEKEEVEEKREEPKEEETEKEDIEETEEDEVDYENLVDNTITEAKEIIKEKKDIDYKEIIKAEEENKNRKTFIDWLEGRKDS